MFTNRARWRRACLFALAALLTAACQRTLVNLQTPVGGAAPTATVRITGERVAQVQVVTGVVDTRPDPDSPWTAAAVGQLLAEGHTIRTGPGSRALVQLTEGTKIWLGSGTTFTVTILNPFLDSLLTSLQLDQGQVWVLLNGGALDVETPVGVAAARSAYLSAAFDTKTVTLDITCLQGTCSFGGVFIPSTFKMLGAGRNATPEPMTLADFGVWGLNVPEATQLAALATEALVQGNATLPVVPTKTATQAPATPTPPRPPATAAPVVPTAIPPTTRPLPTLGQHTVRAGDTIFCIARGYGVLPAAIAEANGLTAPFTVIAGDKLKIPGVQWTDISPGPVCQPQFVSPYPGLRVPTSTPAAPAPTAAPAATSAPPTAAPTIAPLAVQVSLQCLASCGGGTQYRLRLTVTVSGGRPPYTYNPVQQLDFDVPHCVDQSGTVTVSSADGQTLTSPWSFHDTGCAPTSSP